MATISNFKLLRLEEKHKARSRCSCPKQHKNICLLIASQCAYYNHPKMRDGDTCFCQAQVPVSDDFQPMRSFHA